jgi:hypothetical protein
MKKVFLFVAVVCVLFFTGGATLYAVSTVPEVGDVDLTNLVLPQPTVDEAALDYLQVLMEVENGISPDSFYEVASYFADQIEASSQAVPVRGWPEK